VTSVVMQPSSRSQERPAPAGLLIFWPFRLRWALGASSALVAPRAKDRAYIVCHKMNPGDMKVTVMISNMLGLYCLDSLVSAMRKSLS
jgi:hypothetical protein